MPVIVRPMLSTDLDAAAAAGAAGMGFVIEDDAEWRRWRDRLAYPLDTDPGGAFVAESDGRVIGVSQAVQRESLWVLSFLAVDPGAQRTGAGRALMRAALTHGDPSRGLIVASDHPVALRLYTQAGFTPRRALRTLGRVDRGALPERSRAVRPGSESDLPLAAEISREQRGAPHTDEIRFALRRGGQLLVCPGRGFAVALRDYGVWLLAARDEPAAEALLWRALDIGGTAEQPVRWVIAGNEWAATTLRSAGLNLVEHGAVCVRGEVGPLAPYLPSAPFV